MLGESLAVELANTSYATPGATIDFLSDDAFPLWFAHAPAAADLEIPADLGPKGRADIRSVRDAARLLLDDGADSVTLAAAVKELHAAAGRAPAHVELTKTGAGGWSWQLQFHGTDGAVLVATIASRCVLFIGGDDFARVRRCERPGCPMLFVQHHRARRFCHEVCAHSVRQARYYRSQRSRPSTDPADEERP